MAKPLGYTRTQDHWEDFPSTATPADGGDLENYDQGHLMNNNTRMEFVWNGSTYVPAKYTPAEGVSLSDTSRLRRFTGPTDPSTVTGVVMGEGDTWRPVT